MGKKVKTKTVSVGVVYQVKGYIDVEVPVTLTTKKAILDHLQDIEDKTNHLPLPVSPSYLDGSFEIDSIDGTNKEDIEPEFNGKCLDCGEQIVPDVNGADDLFCSMECRHHYMANHPEE